ncbi:MAG: hypothetical protein ACQETP_06335 [Bacteroidota bacterium]
MNVQLLETVRRTIVYRPERFCLAQWAFARNEQAVRSTGAEPRGFTCCIAGHVLLEAGTYTERELLLHGGFHTGGRLWNEAGKVLELSTPQYRTLFFPSQWEKPYKQEYYLCSAEEEAEVAASYLDHYITKHAHPEYVPTQEPQTSERAQAVMDTV